MKFRRLLILAPAFPDKNQTARGHPTLKGWGMLRAARFG